MQLGEVVRGWHAKLVEQLIERIAGDICELVAPFAHQPVQAASRADFDLSGERNFGGSLRRR